LATKRLRESAEERDPFAARAAAGPALPSKGRSADLNGMDARPERASTLVTVTFTRISVRADQMAGVPCIRGLRIPIATVVDMVADGMSATEIVEAFPELEADDVTEALRYAAEAVRERELPLAAAG
jgi:uncharacterized protein (DUF433 family)